MRLRLLTVSFALVATAATAAFAASGLKTTMKSWKLDGTAAADMVAGRAAFNEAELRRILQTFVKDSQGFEARIKPSNAEATDLKTRFAKFEADSTAALAVAGQASQAKGRIATVLNNCKSCHDVHAN
ncbi:MAG: hypothetical protein P4L98_10065 [Ancalomicrobiaceae bacterium]|nr:hypothetical protein [Ancalomicrobiaceae bacterium]